MLFSFICCVLNHNGLAIPNIYVTAHRPGYPVSAGQTDADGSVSLYIPYSNYLQIQSILSEECPRFTLSFAIAHLREYYQISLPYITTDIRLEPMHECCATLQFIDSLTYHLSCTITRQAPAATKFDDDSAKQVVSGKVPDAGIAVATT